MNKKLLTQIKNEWRTNLWLFIELLIVSVVLWYVVDYFYSNISTRLLPRGFNTEHCYLINVSDVNFKSPEFIKDRTDEEKRNDRMELMERLRRRPEIEAVSWSQNSFPYNGSNSGSNIMFVNDGDTIQSSGYIVHRMVTPDFVRVFRYEGANGETPEELAKMLADRKILINDDIFSDHDISMKDHVNKEITVSYSSSEPRRIGAAIVKPRYCDYQTWGQTVIVPMPHDWLAWANELCIRVKPDMDRDVAENIMKDANSQLRIGNFMITEVRSFKDVRRNFQTFYTNTERNYYAGMGFLLLNIFLGLLGTFWFRTQQRVSEIAIRKVNGSTSRSIFFRLISEGMLLLTIATIPAIVIDVVLSWNEFNTSYDGYLSWGRTSICILITYLLMSLMIVLGILIPARRAMRIQPAIALKDE